MTNTYRRQPLASRLFGGPPRLVNNIFGHLSGGGFRSVVRPTLALFSMLVMVETAYKAMPNTNWSVPRQERAFIPKAGINDDAQLSRVWAPIRTAHIVADSIPVLGREIPDFTGERPVLVDPTFWLAVIIAAAIQRQESKIFYRKSYAEVKKEFDEANRLRKVEPDENATELATLKAMGVNSYGMGNEAANGGMVLLLYGIEFVSCFFAFKGADNLAAALVWSVISVWGFEAFHERDDNDDNADNAKNSNNRRRRRQRRSTPRVLQ